MTRALCLIFVLAAGLRGDIYEELKDTYNHSVITTYECGHQGSLRLWQVGNFRNPYILIWNEERQTIYQLDPPAHEYVEPLVNDWVAQLAWRIAHPHIHNSGKTVNIYYETTDTGERRQILGQTAKRMIYRERHVAPPGACDASSEKEVDGWYITFPERDPGGLPEIAKKHAFRHYDPAEVYLCRDIVVKHGDPNPPGFLVLHKEDQHRHIFEVVALSASPLSKSLFEPPSNYKKVDHLKSGFERTWTVRLSWEWEQLVGSVSTWFK